MILILPYRLQSNRFPNKILSKVFGISLIERSLKTFTGRGYRVIVTAPEEDFCEEVQLLQSKYNFDFIASPITCRSGTERVLHISRRIRSDYYSLIPVDEPLLSFEEINKIILGNSLEDLNTFYTNFYCREDCISKLSSKVVMTVDNYLLYQSRNVIPIRKLENFNHEDCYKHVGVKIFSDKGLSKIISRQFIPTKLDMIEGLEELRLIELGFRVKMHEILHDGFGVDIPEQISILESRYGYSKG